MTNTFPDCTFEARAAYVFCRYAGPFQAECLVSLGSAVGAFCAEHQLDRVLVDFRESEGDLTFEDRYRIANNAPYAAPLTLRVAICIRSDQGDAQRTWTSAMSARGFLARAFFDEGPAIEWLLSSQPVEAPSVASGESDA